MIYRDVKEIDFFHALNNGLTETQRVQLMKLSPSERRDIAINNYNQHKKEYEHRNGKLVR